MLIGNNWCFIHVPRTSGTCIRQFLIEHTDSSEYKNVHTKHGEIEFGLDQYFCFGFVRNPYDREYSLYTLAKAHKVARVDFETWITNKFVKLENTHRFIDAYELQKDYFKDTAHVFKYESRNEALIKISDNLGLDSNKFISYILYRNSYKYDTDYRSQYTNSSYDIVTKALEQDIETFGYTFEWPLMYKYN